MNCPTLSRKTAATLPRSDVYFAIVPVELLRDVSATAVCVYAVLAEAANSDGVSWPSLATIGKRIGKSGQQAQRGKAELVARGWVTERGRIRDDGSQTSNEYTVFRTPNQKRHGAGVKSDMGAVSNLMHEPDPVEPDPKNKPLEGFVEFWAAVPNKIGKAPSEKAWIKAIAAGASPLDLVDGMTRHAAWHVEAKTERRFIPHPATWLNQCRWDDELLPIEPVFVPDPGPVRPGYKPFGEDTSGPVVDPAAASKMAGIRKKIR